MQKITVSNLEYVLNDLISRLKNEGIESIEIEDDFYWNIPKEAVAEFPHEPSLTVGSLKDDIGFLESLQIERYSTNYLELERLSSIFKVLVKKLG